MIQVKKLSKEQWELMREDAHIAVFSEMPGTEQVDFALITVKEDTDELVQYVAIREYDAESIHWFYGGSFDKYRGTVLAYRSMEALIGWARANYKKLSYFTSNRNYPMIKFGVKHKFEITGMRLVKDGLLLEHVLDFTKHEKSEE